jgi:hypothetical protein
MQQPLCDKEYAYSGGSPTHDSSLVIRFLELQNTQEEVVSGAIDNLFFSSL